MTASPTELRYGTAPSQYVLFHTPSAPSTSLPLAVFLHGGFWKSAYSVRPPTCSSKAVAPDLLARGFAVAEVEYRRDADEHWGFPHTNDDVSAAVALSRAQPRVDPARVFLVGHSAGGTLALWQAAQEAQGPGPTALRTYALAPVADLRRAVAMRLGDEGDVVQKYMHGIPEEIPAAYEKACPMDLVNPLVRVGVTVVVGLQDAVVPAEIILGFYEKLTMQAKLVGSCMEIEIKKFEGANHRLLVSTSEEPWRWVAADMERRGLRGKMQ